MRNIIASLLITGFLLIGSLPLTAAQEEDLTTVTLPILTLEIGDTATLDVAIDCAAEGGCSAFDIALAFNPAVIQLDSAAVGPYLGDQVFTVENIVDNDAGTLHLVAAVLGDMPDPASDILFTLAITARAAGTSPITFTHLDIADAVGFPAAAEGIAGEITVMPEPDPELGAALFADTGCAACHGEEDGAGPALMGMGGRATTRIEGMRAEDYLRASILDPAAYVVAGYSAIMPPTYDDLLSDHEIDSLITYILGPPDAEIVAAAPTETPEPMPSPSPSRHASIGDIEAIMPAKSDVGLGGLPLELNTFNSTTRTLSQLVALLDSAGLVQLAAITAEAGEQHGEIAQVVRAWDSRGECTGFGLYEFQVLVILFETELGARSHLYDFDMYEAHQNEGAFDEFEFSDDGVLAIGRSTTACGSVATYTKIVPYGRFQIATLMVVRADMNSDEVLAWLTRANSHMTERIEAAGLE